MKEAIQFAILGQSADGLNWLANAFTLEDAREQIDAGDFDRQDAVLVLPVAYTIQFDR